MLRRLLSAAAVAFLVVPAQAADHQIQFGLAEYAGAAQCQREADLLGIKSCTQYYTVGRTTKLTHAALPVGYHPVLALQFPTTEGGIHQAIMVGGFDAALMDLVRRIQMDARPVSFRVMPEPNGFWSKYGGYAAGQTPDSYVKAFRYVVDFLRRELGEDMITSIELNLSRRSFDWNKKSLGTADFGQFYPGDTYVDIVAASTYNRCGTSLGHTQVVSFADGFRAFYQAALKLGKPIGVAEVASSPYCNVDMVKWYQEMFKALETEFPAVESIYFFFENTPVGKASNTVETRWGAILYEDPGALKRLIAPRQKASVPIPVRRVEVDPTGPLNFDVSGLGADRWFWQWGGSAGYVFDPENTALSPLSGQQFGSTEWLLRSDARLGLEWDFGDDFTFRPYLGAGIVTSSNDDMWWNNKFGPVLGMEFCTRAPAFADWGRVCLTAEGRYDFYTADTPSYLDDGGFVGFGGLKWQIGGGGNLD